MLFFAFTIAIATSLALLGLLCWSLAMPDQRVWPPPRGKADWRFWLVWLLIGLLIVSAIFVALLDFGSLGLDGWPWRAIGALLVLLGNALAWWGVAVLGAATTTGLAGDLVTDGPYRFTRNPQYLGDIVILIGFVVLANSWLALCPSLVTIASAVAAPFAEEGWLEKRFGAAYQAYKRRVPRFFGPL